MDDDEAPSAATLATLVRMSAILGGGGFEIR